MKRKLDQKDEPAPSPEHVPTHPDMSTMTTQMAPAEVTAEEQQEQATFAELGLDPRLLQAISVQSFQRPTLVQAKAIPLALEGRDVLARAKTGSGKTAAYCLPVLQAILKRKQTSSASHTAALILVPTRELADQVARAIDLFSAFAVREIQTVKLSEKLSDSVTRSMLTNSPDIVVTTPARAWQNIRNGALSLDKTTHLVIDEADLVLSYGYDDDLANVAAALPKGVQITMMSATLTAEVATLKGIFCCKPVLLDLVEPEAEGKGISQFYVKCAEDEKFLLSYVIFKLQLIKGKSIIFVADVDRCYRLKLFFEQFGIRSCILNSELPVNSRIHVVEEFNRNVYDIVICSDENEILGGEEAAVQGEHESTAKSKEKKDDSAPPKKKQKPSRRDKEYGVSRGIDFKNVACVINFDLPTTSKSYTHRIGRTARAGQTGMALSFVIPKECFRKHMPTSVATAENDEEILAKIIKQQAKTGKDAVKPYLFDMKQVDAFRYRMNDALRAVTKVAIREARTRELRQELLKSEKLKRHFEEKPDELHHLRHDGELRSARTQAHLKHIPDYLLPAEGKKALTTNDIGFVPFKVRDGKGRKGKSFKGRGKKTGGRKNDPLKTFKGRPKGK